MKAKVAAGTGSEKPTKSRYSELRGMLEERRRGLEEVWETFGKTERFWR